MKKHNIITITGYRNYELGIFQEKDAKLAILYQFIKHSLRQLLENGGEWLIIGGNLGIELWSAKMAYELKNEGFDVKVAVFLPFKSFGENWKGYNQQLFEEVITQADYLNFVSHKEYESPLQLKNHSKFLIEHSNMLWAIYDREFPGKAQYIIQDWIATGKDFQLCSMDDLQSFANDLNDF